ncbi:histidine kinase, partial [Streptomyces kronopolitis]
GPRPVADREASGPTTPQGLPRRVRQASLAPQLKKDPAAEAAPAPAADDRDAEAVRARMASLQRGWQRGRRDNAEDPRESAPALSADPADTTPDATGPDPTDAGDRDATRHDGDGTGTTAPPGNTSGGDGP